LIDSAHSEITIERQCELLDLSRSAYYYQPRPESDLNQMLMRLIDEQYTRTPFYGVPRITVSLRRQGFTVNHKRVARLMRLMGLEAIYPKPRLSRPSREHKVYPYLLKGVSIDRPDQVWSTDITYIRMTRGFLYLTAIMDWFSRYVLAWAISNTLETDFCLEALEVALNRTKPEIFNSDQGSQFTSLEFTGFLEAHGITISMDGQGRVFDNIFVERLWRTVKYEEVYLKQYRIVREARSGLKNYFEFYNTDRPHSSLEDHTPEEIYFKKRCKQEPEKAQEKVHLKLGQFLS